MKILPFPEGEDPVSFARKHYSTEYREFIDNDQIDFIHFKSNLLMKESANDPIKRAECVNSIVQSIAMIPDAIIRSVYTKESSRILDMNERLLISAVSKTIKANEEGKLKRSNYETRRQSVPQGGAPVAPPPYQEKTITAPPVSAAPPIEIESEVSGSTVMSVEVPPPPFSTSDSSIGLDESGNFYSAPQATAAPVIESTGKKPYFESERLLAQILVRYGERVMLVEEREDGSKCEVTVADYVIDDLEQDELTFHDPMHAKIFSELKSNKNAEGFVAERFFLHHQDVALSSAAGELALDRYQLSKSAMEASERDEDRLLNLVPRLVYDFKFAILNEELREVMRKLQNPEIVKDEESCNAVMAKYKQIKDILQLERKSVV